MESGEWATRIDAAYCYRCSVVSVSVPFSLYEPIAVPFGVLTRVDSDHPGKEARLRVGGSYLGNGHVSACLQPIYSTLFAKGQERCGI